MPLTPKQEIFVREWLVDCNGAQAAIRAGYSAKTARTIASELLAKDEVSAAIKAGMEARAKRLDLSADRVVQEAVHLALADITEAVEWGDAVAVKDAETGEVTIAQGIALVPAKDLPARMRSAIAEVSQTKEGLKLKMHSKTAGLEMLFKHLGLYPSGKLEVTGKDGGPIETKDATPAAVARKVAALIAEVQAQQQPAKEA